jgi:hypothetical protein
LPLPEVWLAPSTLNELIVKSRTGGGAGGFGLGFGFLVGFWVGDGLAVIVTERPGRCDGTALGGGTSDGVPAVGLAGMLDGRGAGPPETWSESWWTTYATPMPTSATKTAAVTRASTPGVHFTAERYPAGRPVQTGLRQL